MKVEPNALNDQEKFLYLLPTPSEAKIVAQYVVDASDFDVSKYFYQLAQHCIDHCDVEVTRTPGTWVLPNGYYPMGMLCHRPSSK